MAVPLTGRRWKPLIARPEIMPWAGADGCVNPEVFALLLVALAKHVGFFNPQLSTLNFQPAALGLHKK